MSERILVCVRVADDAEPVRGSFRDVCGSCDAPVWRSSLTAPLRIAAVSCIDCALADGMGPVEVRPELVREALEDIRRRARTDA